VSGKCSEYLFIIIIISPLLSTAGHRPLQSLAMSLDLRLLASSSCHPSRVNRHSTFTETQSPLQNSFTPAVVGSTADMASPLPLHHANTVCYVGDFSSLPDYLFSDLIPQRNPEHSSFHSSLGYTKLSKFVKLIFNIIYCTIKIRLHTYIPLTLYSRRGSRGISDIPTRFTKII
jgi:hypothetical protein